MRPLSAARREIFEKIRKSQQILLLLDYDGTLVPIRSRPELAKLATSQKELLEHLSDSPRLKAGIVTGRGLKDIRKAVGLPGLVYAANHGLEIATGKRHWIHPAARAAARLIGQTVLRLRRAFGPFPGVWVEDKEFSLAVHYRQFKGRPSFLKRRMLEAANAHPGRLRLTRGKMIYELRPAVSWDKGRALVKIENLLGYRKKPLVIFLGDDLTDEDAFHRMSKKDVSILVGLRKNSAARYNVRNRKAVSGFLEQLKKSDSLERRT